MKPYSKGWLQWVLLFFSFPQKSEGKKRKKKEKKRKEKEKRKKGGGKNRKKKKNPESYWKISLQGQLSAECIWVFRVPIHAEHQKLGSGPSPILTGLSPGLVCATVLNSKAAQCLRRAGKQQDHRSNGAGLSRLLNASLFFQRPPTQHTRHVKKTHKVNSSAAPGAGLFWAKFPI